MNVVPLSLGKSARSPSITSLAPKWTYYAHAAKRSRRRPAHGIELIGLGTGAGTKTRILLRYLDSPVAYVPVDISKEQLMQSTAAFRRIFPALEILPVCADYLEPFELPTPLRPPLRKVVYFPGSTLGNLSPNQAHEFLEKITEMAGKTVGSLSASI